MTPKSTWVEALNISPEQLSAWSALAPDGKPLLVWCLEQGHLSVPEYLEWASEAFGLAVLSSGFFFEEGPHQETLRTHKGRAAWSAWCFPVEAWDGTLFVACVEPPAEPEAHTAYVLADPRLMADAWLSDFLVPVEVDEPAPFDAPIGLNLDAKPFVLNFDEADLMSNLEPEGPKPPPPLEAHVDLTGPEDLAPPDLPDLMAGFEDPPMPTLPATPKLHVVPPPHEAITKPSRPEATEALVLNAVFAEVQKTYAHACVVHFNADQIANIYKWSNSLRPIDEGIKASINLGYPSFLRIVHRTGMPYHGYLVDSPAHHEFFQALGLEDLPACVSAVPLRVDDQIWGVLLALGADGLQTAENLAMLNQQAEALLNQLGAGWSNLAS